MGPHDADRLAGLHQHRLVVAERGQRAHHGVERSPAARRPSGAAVDDEVVGPLGHLGVEVVHQHPQRGSVCHDRAVSPRPRGDLTGRAPSMIQSFTSRRTQPLHPSGGTRESVFGDRSYDQLNLPARRSPRTSPDGVPGGTRSTRRRATAQHSAARVRGTATSRPTTDLVRQATRAPPLRMPVRSGEGGRGIRNRVARGGPLVTGRAPEGPERSVPDLAGWWWWP